MIHQFVNLEFFKSRVNHKFIGFDIVSVISRHKAYLREPPVLIKDTRLKRKHKFCDSVFVVKTQALAGFSQGNEPESLFVQRGEMQP